MTAGSLDVDFGALSGKGVRVAIVDTGIDPTHERVHGISYGVGLRLSARGEVHSDPDSFDRYGHGTACAAIIRQIAPECDLIAVRIASDTTTISARLLRAGMEWALDHGADVISVSAGTSTGSEGAAFESFCSRAASMDVPVVAAESNDGRRTFPAACESTLVVGAELTNPEPYAFRSDPTQKRRFTAFGGHQKAAWLQPRYIFAQGTSFANPRLAGIVALIIQQHGRVPLERLLSILEQNALSEPSSPRHESGPSEGEGSSRSLDWIHRAALYPYSKENQSLVRFRHLVPFAVTGVADPIGKRMVGKDAGEVLGIESVGITVQASIEAALEDADTLVLGFISELGRLRSRDLREELLRRAIELGKNVYSFEPLDRVEYEPLLNEAARLGLHVAWPSVSDGDLEDLRRQDLARYSYTETPILGVFGTSSAQGKFTMQLLLRECLAKKGIRVSQIGTEHQSRLLGMDEAFPLGHVKNVTLGHYAWSEYFELRYQQLVRDSRPDLIIVGSQGSIIPYRLRPAEHLKTYVNLAFLMAVRADSYVLVVNHHDSFDYVQDAMDALRIIGKGRTILLAVSNRRRRIIETFGRRIVTVDSVDPEEQADFLRRLEERFRLPAVTILDSASRERIVDIVIGAYSGD